MIYDFSNDGDGFIDEARCAACAEWGADTEIRIEGSGGWSGSGYICQACLHAVHTRGVAGWQKYLRTWARRLRLMAERAERAAAGMEPGAECRFAMAIKRDAYGDFTALGHLPDDHEEKGRWTDEGDKGER